MFKNTKNLLAVLLLMVPAAGWADTNTTNKEQTSAVASNGILENFSILSPTKDGLKELALAALVVRPAIQMGIINPLHEVGHAAVFGTIPGVVRNIRPYPHFIGNEFETGSVGLNLDAIEAHARRFPLSTAARVYAAFLAGPVAGIAAAVALSKFTGHESCPESVKEPLRFAACIAGASQFRNLVPIEGRDGGQIIKAVTGGCLKGSVRTVLMFEVVDKFFMAYLINKQFPNFFKLGEQKKDEITA